MDNYLFLGIPLFSTLPKVGAPGLSLQNSPLLCGMLMMYSSVILS